VNDAGGFAAASTPDPLMPRKRGQSAAAPSANIVITIPTNIPRYRMCIVLQQ
jgi:hypothetical protein